MTHTAPEATARSTGTDRHVAFGVFATVATVALGGLALASGGPWQAWDAWSGETPDRLAGGALEVGYSRMLPVLWVAEVVAACGLALFLAWKASHRIEARILAIFLLGLVMPGTGGALSAVDLPRWVELALVFGVVWLGAGAFVRLATVFPHRLATDDVRTDSSGRVRRAVAALDRLMLRPAAPWTLAAAATALIAVGEALDGIALENVGDWLILAGLTAFPVALAEGVRLLRRGYRLAEPEARRRALWMVAGLAGAAGLLVVVLLVLPLLGTALLPIWPDVFQRAIELTVLAGAMLLPLAPVLVIAGIATGVFYTGAIDPGLVLRRTTIYGALGVLDTFVFAGLEELVTSYIVDRFGLPESTGPILAGGVIAVLAGSLYGRLRRWLAVRGGDADGPRHESRSHA